MSTMQSNRIVSVQYDMVEDLMQVRREDGSVEPHPYSPRLAALSTEYEDWSNRANCITPHEVRYAFWLGADA